MPDQPVTITWEQVRAVWAAISTVEHIRRQEGARSMWDNPQPDLAKSRLLGRILIEGKEPLPFKPQNADAGGWYSLYDNHGAWLTEHGIPSGSHEHDGKQMVAMVGSLWDVVEKRGTNDWVLRDRSGFEWRLRPVVDGDDPPAVGRRRVGEGWEPVLASFRIEPWGDTAARLLELGVGPGG